MLTDFVEYPAPEISVCFDSRCEGQLILEPHVGRHDASNRVRERDPYQG